MVGVTFVGSTTIVLFVAVPPYSVKFTFCAEISKYIATSLYHRVQFVPVSLFHVPLAYASVLRPLTLTSATVPFVLTAIVPFVEPVAILLTPVL